MTISSQVQLQNKEENFLFLLLIFFSYLNPLFCTALNDFSELKHLFNLMELIFSLQKYVPSPFYPRNLSQLEDRVCFQLVRISTSIPWISWENLPLVNKSSEIKTFKSLKHF